MKKQFSLSFYSLLFALTFFLERVTKWWAFYHLADQELHPLPGVRLALVWNKGISWNLLTPTTTFGSYFLTAVIAGIIALFLLYTVLEYKKGTLLFFEIFVLAGACSNLLDRLNFGAVIDFVECSILTWSWPVFNGADVLVVGGIMGIIIRNWKER